MAGFTAFFRTSREFLGHARIASLFAVMLFAFLSQNALAAGYIKLGDIKGESTDAHAPGAALELTFETEDIGDVQEVRFEPDILQVRSFEQGRGSLNVSCVLSPEAPPGEVEITCVCVHLIAADDGDQSEEEASTTLTLLVSGGQPELTGIRNSSIRVDSPDEPLRIVIDGKALEEFVNEANIMARVSGNGIDDDCDVVDEDCDDASLSFSVNPPSSGWTGASSLEITVNHPNIVRFIGAVRLDTSSLSKPGTLEFELTDVEGSLKLLPSGKPAPDQEAIVLIGELRGSVPSGSGLAQVRVIDANQAAVPVESSELSDENADGARVRVIVRGWDPTSKKQVKGAADFGDEIELTVQCQIGQSRFSSSIDCPIEIVKTEKKLLKAVVPPPGSPLVGVVSPEEIEWDEDSVELTAMIGREFAQEGDEVSVSIAVAPSMKGSVFEGMEIECEAGDVELDKRQHVSSITCTFPPVSSSDGRNHTYKTLSTIMTIEIGDAAAQVPVEFPLRFEDEGSQAILIGLLLPAVQKVRCADASSFEFDIVFEGENLNEDYLQGVAIESISLGERELTSGADWDFRLARSADGFTGHVTVLKIAAGGGGGPEEAWLEMCGGQPLVECPLVVVCSSPDGSSFETESSIPLEWPEAIPPAIKGLEVSAPAQIQFSDDLTASCPIVLKISVENFTQELLDSLEFSVRGDGKISGVSFEPDSSSIPSIDEISNGTMEVRGTLVFEAEEEQEIVTDADASTNTTIEVMVEGLRATADTGPVRWMAPESLSRSSLSSLSVEMPELIEFDENGNAVFDVVLTIEGENLSEKNFGNPVVTPFSDDSGMQLRWNNGNPMFPSTVTVRVVCQVACSVDPGSFFSGGNLAGEVDFEWKVEEGESVVEASSGPVRWMAPESLRRGPSVSGIDFDSASPLAEDLSTEIVLRLSGENLGLLRRSGDTWLDNGGAVFLSSEMCGGVLQGFEEPLDGACVISDLQVSSDGESALLTLACSHRGPGKRLGKSTPFLFEARISCPGGPFDVDCPLEASEALLRELDKATPKLMEFQGGVNVAVGDINGDGLADLIVSGRVTGQALDGLDVDDLNISLRLAGEDVDIDDVEITPSSSTSFDLSVFVFEPNEIAASASRSSGSGGGGGGGMVRIRAMCSVDLAADDSDEPVVLETELEYIDEDSDGDTVEDSDAFEITDFGMSRMTDGSLQGVIVIEWFEEALTDNLEGVEFVCNLPGGLLLSTTLDESAAGGKPKEIVVVGSKGSSDMRQLLSSGWTGGDVDVEIQATEVRAPRDSSSGMATGRRDAASGMATGRRQHKPVRFTKRIDKATPLIMNIAPGSGGGVSTQGDQLFCPLELRLQGENLDLVTTVCHFIFDGEDNDCDSTPDDLLYEGGSVQVGLLLPAVQKVREAAARNGGSPPQGTLVLSLIGPDGSEVSSSSVDIDLMQLEGITDYLDPDDDGDGVPTAVDYFYFDTVEIEEIVNDASGLSVSIRCSDGSCRLADGSDVPVADVSPEALADRFGDAGPTWGFDVMIEGESVNFEVQGCPVTQPYRCVLNFPHDDNDATQISKKVRSAGLFDGELTQYCVVSPRDASSGRPTGRRDAASGMATGKRQHKPVRITKEIDKATPLLMGVAPGGGGSVTVRGDLLLCPLSLELQGENLDLVTTVCHFVFDGEDNDCDDVIDDLRWDGGTVRIGLLLPAVQKVREAAARSGGLPPGTLVLSLLSPDGNEAASSTLEIDLLQFEGWPDYLDDDSDGDTIDTADEVDYFYFEDVQIDALDPDDDDDSVLDLSIRCANAMCVMGDGSVKPVSELSSEQLSDRFGAADPTWGFDLELDGQSYNVEISHNPLAEALVHVQVPRSSGDGGFLECFLIQYCVVAPRDAASGQATGRRDAASGLPTGKRQHKPIKITKEIDKSSPLLFNALVTNENLVVEGDNLRFGASLALDGENLDMGKLHVFLIDPQDGSETEMDTEIDEISSGQATVQIGLLLPAVQKVREAASRSRSREDVYVWRLRCAVDDNDGRLSAIEPEGGFSLEFSELSNVPGSETNLPDYFIFEQIEPGVASMREGSLVLAFACSSGRIVMADGSVVPVSDVDESLLEERFPGLRCVFGLDVELEGETASGETEVGLRDDSCVVEVRFAEEHRAIITDGGERSSVNVTPFCRCEPGQSGRETGSGQSTGKRDAASGLPTGKRQHKPIKLSVDGSGLGEGMWSDYMPGDVPDYLFHDKYEMQQIVERDGGAVVLFVCSGPMVSMADGSVKPASDVDSELLDYRFPGLRCVVGLDVLFGGSSSMSSGETEVGVLDASCVIEVALPDSSLLSSSSSLSGDVTPYCVCAPRDAASGMATGRRDAASGLATGRRDAASGLPTGKRQHKPLTITKEIDKSTPLLYQSLGFSSIDISGLVSDGEGLGGVCVVSDPFAVDADGNQVPLRSLSDMAGVPEFEDGVLVMVELEFPGGQTMTGEGIMQAGDSSCSCAMSYMKFDGVDGESSESSGSREIEILAWSWAEPVAPRDSASGLATGRRDAASGMATGRRMHEPIVIRKEIDMSSPVLAKSSVHRGHVTVLKLADGGNDGDATLEFEFSVFGRQLDKATPKLMVTDPNTGTEYEALLEIESSSPEEITGKATVRIDKINFKQEFGPTQKSSSSGGGGYFEAWPCKWKGFTLDGKGTDVAMEEIVLVIERIDLPSGASSSGGGIAAILPYIEQENLFRDGMFDMDSSGNIVFRCSFDISGEGMEEWELRCEVPSPIDGSMTPCVVSWDENSSSSKKGKVEASWKVEEGESIAADPSSERYANMEVSYLFEDASGRSSGGRENQVCGKTEHFIVAGGSSGGPGGGSKQGDPDANRYDFGNDAGAAGGGSSSGDPVPVEEISLNFAKIEWTYKGDGKADLVIDFSLDAASPIPSSILAGAMATLSSDAFDSSSSVVEYQDGTDLFVRKRPGRVKYSDITLKPGYGGKKGYDYYQEKHTLDATLSISLFSGSSDSRAVADWVKDVYQGKECRSSVRIDGNGGTMAQDDWEEPRVVAGPTGSGLDSVSVSGTGYESLQVPDGDEGDVVLRGLVINHEEQFTGDGMVDILYRLEFPDGSSYDGATEYQDGNDLILRKRPGRTKYSNITLKHGMLSENPDGTMGIIAILIGLLDTGQEMRQEISIRFSGDDSSSAARYYQKRKLNEEMLEQRGQESSGNTGDGGSSSSTEAQDYNSSRSNNINGNSADNGGGAGDGTGDGSGGDRSHDVPGPIDVVRTPAPPGPVPIPPPGQAGGGGGAGGGVSVELLDVRMENWHDTDSDDDGVCDIVVDFVIDVDSDDPLADMRTNFAVLLGGSSYGGTAEFQDNGDMTMRKRPGRVRYGNITLKRGYINDSSMSFLMTMESSFSGDGRAAHEWKRTVTIKEITKDGGAGKLTGGSFSSIDNAPEEKERGITINTSHVEYRSARTAGDGGEDPALELGELQIDLQETWRNPQDGDGEVAYQLVFADGSSLSGVIEYQDGEDIILRKRPGRSAAGSGDNPITQKRPGRVKYSNITLKRGVASLGQRGGQNGIIAILIGLLVDGSQASCEVFIPLDEETARWWTNQKMSSATDHNSSRSNKTSSSRAAGQGGGDGDEDDDNDKAQDHNSSRSNKTSSVAAPEDGGTGSGGDGEGQKAQDHNSSRSNKTSSVAAPDGDNGSGGAGDAEAGAEGADYNSSRSNKTHTPARESGEEEEGFGNDLDNGGMTSNPMATGGMISDFSWTQTEGLDENEITVALGDVNGVTTYTIRRWESLQAWETMLSRIRKRPDLLMQEWDQLIDSEMEALENNPLFESGNTTENPLFEGSVAGGDDSSAGAGSNRRSKNIVHRDIATRNILQMGADAWLVDSEGVGIDSLLGIPAGTAADKEHKDWIDLLSMGGAAGNSAATDDVIIDGNIITAQLDVNVAGDDFGQYRVSFPLDNNLLDTDGSWYFLPEMDDELLVSFLEGDPDKPVVIGRLYAKDAPQGSIPLNGGAISLSCSLVIEGSRSSGDGGALFICAAVDPDSFELALIISNDIQMESRKYQKISNALKASHQASMNSIRNIK